MLRAAEDLLIPVLSGWTTTQQGVHTGHNMDVTSPN
jgi:hypothetical protein